MFPDVFAIYFGAFHVERTRRPSFHLCWDPYGWEANSGRSYTLSKKPSWRMFTPCMSLVLAVCIGNFGWNVLCCGCGRCHIQSDPIGDFTESHRKSDSLHGSKPWKILGNSPNHKSLAKFLTCMAYIYIQCNIHTNCTGICWVWTQ